MSTIPPAGQDPLDPERAFLPAQQQSPPATDPLVPANFAGWVERVLGVARRSFAQLAVLQVIVAAVGVVAGVAMAAMAPDFAALDAQLQPGTPLTPDQISGFATIWVISIIDMLVMGVLSAYVYSASLFVAIRDAAGQPTTAVEGLRLGARRALPLLGWGLLAGVLVALGFVFFVLPAVYLAIVFAALPGVVVVERAGIGRCFTLVNPRFLPTAGRLLLTALASIAYLVIVVAVTGGFSSSAPSVITTIVRQILFIPVGVVGAAVVVVTYAELRFHERGVNTTTLVAELSR